MEATCYPLFAAQAVMSPQGADESPGRNRTEAGCGFAAALLTRSDNILPSLHGAGCHVGGPERAGRGAISTARRSIPVHTGIE